mgnify:CR=1 FL=1
MDELRRRIEGTTVKTAGKEIRITITGGIATGMADSNYEKVIRSADDKKIEISFLKSIDKNFKTQVT